MKVYIITKEPFPNGMAATNRIKCYAKAIISQGVDCEVLIFCRTETVNSVKNKKTEGIYEGIPFKYVSGTPIRSKNNFVCKVNSICDRLVLLKYLKRHIHKNDSVIGFGNQHLLLYRLIIGIIHLCGGKYIREVCEYPMGTDREKFYTKFKRKLICHYQYPQCDGFIAISENLVNISNRYKSEKGKVVKIPILVDYDKYQLQDNSKNYDIPYIFHSGTLTEQKDGFLGMIEAFGLAYNKLDKSIKFISTGSIEKIPEKERFLQLIEKFRIKNQVEFTGYLSEDKLKEYLSGASLTIINKYDTLQNRYCFSTKLGEYLAAGKPVIITDVGEAKNWLTDKENALIVENGNVKSLADTIIMIFENEDKRLEIGKNGRKLCKEVFSYQSQAKKLIEFLLSM